MRETVESLARPGGNVTGLTLISGDLGGKRLEVLKEAVPKVVRVAVLYDPTIPSYVIEVKEVLKDAVPKLARVGLLRLPGAKAQELQLKELRAAAPALKLRLEEIETQSDAKGLESAFQTAAEAGRRDHG